MSRATASIARARVATFIARRARRARASRTRANVERSVDQKVDERDERERILVEFVSSRVALRAPRLAHARTMASALASASSGAFEARAIEEGDASARTEARGGGASVSCGDVEDDEVNERSRGEDENGVFYVTALGTARSKKRPCVALDVEPAERGRRFPRAVREAARAEAERIFDTEARDFEVRRGRLVVCDASDPRAVRYDAFEGGEEDAEEEEDEGETDEAPSESSAGEATHVRVELDAEPLPSSEAWDKMLVHAAAVGLPMECALEHVLKNAMHRTGARRATVSPPIATPSSASSSATQKMRVYVIFGGQSSNATSRERSCHTGRQLYLTLRNVSTIDVTPVLLTPHANRGLNSLVDAPSWRLPYAWAIDPTQWETPRAPDLGRYATARRVRAELDKYLWVTPPKHDPVMAFEAQPRVSRLGALLFLAASEGAIVFNAVPDDGSLQQLCTSAGVAYTGCGPLASRVCADKVALAKALVSLRSEGIGCLNKRFVLASTLLNKATEESSWGGRPRVEGAKRLWVDIVGSLGGAAVLPRGARVTPVSEASWGATFDAAASRRLMDENDLLTYAEEEALRPSTIAARGYLFEPHFEPAEVTLASDGQTLTLDETLSKSRWIEVTVGVFGDKPGKLQVFAPSVRARTRNPAAKSHTFAIDHAGSVLSARSAALVRDRARRVADVLQVEGFASIDAYANIDTGEIIIASVDTVLDMTSPNSPVFEQALAENPPIDPETFCVKALSLALVRRYR